MEKIMKNKVYFTIYSLALVLVTTCFFQFIYPPPRDAMAYSDCIRTGLTAKYTNGDVNQDKEFSVLYEIPNCYASYGYSMKTTFIYDDNLVGVTYTNPDFKKTSSGGSSGGGMSPIN